MAPTPPYGPSEFAKDFNVSRETLEMLRTYEVLLRKWQAKINLVGSSTLETLWQRHFQDSAQLLALAPKTAKVWADLGAGAGFPGLVIAIMLRDRPDAQIHLIESDARKCAFLRTVIQALGLTAEVHGRRIGDVPPLNTDVVTARALAPLHKLLELGLPHRKPDGMFLFPKGQDVDKELTEATKSWIISVDRLQSRSDHTGIILRIKEAHLGSS